MDDVERLFRQLVRVLRSRFPEYLDRSFDVAELYQTILPFRHYRRALGLDSNDEYELALVELLSGARGFLIVGDRMRETLTRELDAPSPDAGAFRQFADEHVSVSIEGLRWLDSRMGLEAGVGLGGEKRTEPRGSGTLDPAGPRSSRRIRGDGDGSAGAAGGGGGECRYCDHELPSGRSVTFCPNCGQNVTLIHCPACSAELATGWRFCTACGRPTGAT
jgi:hypothetical protein